MKIKISKGLISLASLALATVPFANAQAENINIYGWQNWSYEYVEYDLQAGGSREYDRMSNNAANIGFMSHMDTGIPGLQVGFRCEQFTYWGRFNNYTGWCNRNSKISLRHEMAGEIMMGQWLLPYNEIVAQWVDPFYDAGADSHTSIMGNIGGSSARAGGWLSSLFYNGSFSKATDFTSQYGALAFNRRQEGVVQYVWPNTSAMADQSRDGFQFRFAVTEGSGVDTPATKSGTFSGEVDPRIISMGAAYQHNIGNDQIWVAVAYEQHEDISATSGIIGDGECGDSDDEAYRIAGRYKHDWGNGQSTWVAAMYEELEYSADCVNGTKRKENPNDPNSNTLKRKDKDVIDYNPFTSVDAPIWMGVDREAWMISGKHVFGNGLDFRFSYMDADEWDCDENVCDAAAELGTDADAVNLGLFYTMPAGTELRATYSEVSNENNAGYDFGINAGAAGAAVGKDIEMFAVGIVHWFD